MKKEALTRVKSHCENGPTDVPHWQALPAACTVCHGVMMLSPIQLCKSGAKGLGRDGFSLTLQSPAHGEAGTQLADDAEGLWLPMQGIEVSAQNQKRNIC